MKNKIIAIGLSLVLCFVLFVAPVITIGAVILEPFETVYNFFIGLGEFIFGSGNNEVIDLINAYFSNSSSQSYLNDYYLPYIREEQDIDIPLNYLVIPNMLIGIEKPTSELIHTQIEAMKLEKKIEVPLYDKDGKPLLDKDGKQKFEIVIEYSLKPLNEYLADLRKKEPWKERFGDISTKTVENYVNTFQALQIYGGLDSEYLAQFEGMDFIYPFTEKATISVEFGKYSYTYQGVRYENVDHYGIDLVFPGRGSCGVPIYAVADGVVAGKQGSNISKTGNYGWVDQGEIRVKYLHMAEGFSYNIGDQIKKGDYIGITGSTGISTGCHLHLQIEVNGVPVNPRNFIEFDNPFGN